MRKILLYFGLTLLLLGLIYTIGIAGSYDQDLISSSEYNTNTIIGLGVFAVGGIIAKIFED